LYRFDSYAAHQFPQATGLSISGGSSPVVIELPDWWAETGERGAALGLRCCGPGWWCCRGSRLGRSRNAA